MQIIIQKGLIIMVNIGGYGQYGVTGKVPYTKTTTPGGRNESKTKNTDRADFSESLRGGMVVGSSKTSSLSKTAQSYLERLRNKYGNMDFIIADYKTDEEADALLSSGKGEYNVLITPDLLEKMAADESVAAEYEGVIESSVNDINFVRSELGEDADMIDRFGITLNADGTISITARLIEGLTGSDGSRNVKASTISELMERLNETKQNQAEKLAEIRKAKAEEAKKTKEKEENEEEKSFSAKA